MVGGSAPMQMKILLVRIDELATIPRSMLLENHRPRREVPGFFIF